MKYFMKILISFLSLALTYSLSYAGEPIVAPPLVEQIQNLIDKQNCPLGYGRIPRETKILIAGRNIPPNENWHWAYTGNSECVSLQDISQLTYLSYYQDGYRSGSHIIIGYGIGEEKYLFPFTFTIPHTSCYEGECYWDCGPFVGKTPPEAIGCEKVNE
jgi:hypothetical protein